MKYDPHGVAYTTSDELCELLYQDPTIDISKFLVTDPDKYNRSVKEVWANMPMLKLYNQGPDDIEQFDNVMQSHWHMPIEYIEMDIAKWVLDQCKTQAELQRVGEELLLYQERELFNLLRYMKYMVDTFRRNNVVWGLGRGSSVASYVLYLIGVHKIDSIYYDLPINEFLK
jgi:Bacterial DNA polymerase III alpha NTPase domain